MDYQECMVEGICYGKANSYFRFPQEVKYRCFLSKPFLFGNGFFFVIIWIFSGEIV